MTPGKWLIWLVALLAPAVSGRAAAPAAWQPGPALLASPWAAEVNPTNVLPEYPRPQLCRPEWLNLNGLWDCRIGTNWDALPEQYDRRILVPFPLESALSGITEALGAQSVLWYRRTVRLPAGWSSQQVLLHFGAVDWETRVWVNGHFAGTHQGGFDPFTFDITAALRPEADQEVVVAVMDPTENDQPRGKQSRKPEGVFYTSTSGIWQTVWLEPVPAINIADLKMTPAADLKSLQLTIHVASLDPDLQVEAVARAGAVEAGRITGRPNERLAVPVQNPHPWSPEDPFLYDLTVRLLKNGRELDRVTSYFGLRHVDLGRDAAGMVRIRLNGNPLFQIGVLDQGFWPEGIYTAPCDAAIRHDLEFVKSGGFNLVRKHVKVEPQRWYYWCDRLGLLVWQDMPCANNNTRPGRLQFETELQRMLTTLHNHPAIISWVLFNEGWGQYDTERLVASVKAADPSRLVDNASGWTDKSVGDFQDAHTYTDPAAPATDGRRASVLGEYGGFGLVLPGHAWIKPWAYRMLSDPETLRAWYAYGLHEARQQYQTRGLCAAVYTQLTDVENESNGLQTYDRRVAKMTPAALAWINSGRDLQQHWRVILPDALATAPARWRYTFETPATNWFLPDFPAATAWPEGAAGFGTDFTRGSQVKTEWATKDLWLRRTFVLGAEDLRQARFRLHHDKAAEVYLNGVLAYSGDSFLAEYNEFSIAPAALATLHPGTNTIAAHCDQTVGGQYLDVGIVAPEPDTTSTP
ncbi:MAG TPA: glycoside hydrolase family 2 TIM barrel-domain containing protein [Dongiaceae bacterium]|jgi:hypothetical protein|nr:glycoside hydrolase family 2 TIM barrel-domain containing protein [Dongiaceae bacterium]